MEQIKDKTDKYIILIMERFGKLENKLEKLYETNNIKDTDLLDNNEAQSLLNVSKKVPSELYHQLADSETSHNRSFTQFVKMTKL